MSRSPRSAAFPILAFGLAAALLASCSSSSTPTTTATSSSSGPPPSITIGTAAALSNFADLYVAQTKGYFKKANVDVTIQSAVGANGLTEVAGGQLDLLMFGTGQALLPAAAGKPTSVIYNFIGAGESGALAVLASSHYTKITDLSGKPVAVLGTGGSSYGWGETYSAYSKTHGGSAFNVVSTSSVSIQVDGLLSGHYAALVSTAALLTPEIQSGKVTLLVDPSKSSASTYVGSPYAEDSVWGLTQTIKQKHVAVVRLLEALRAADTWLHGASPAQIATVLASNSAFTGQTVARLQANAAYDKNFFAPTLGFISKSYWQATLDHLGYWNLPNVDLGSSAASYSARVDMSYWQEAAKHNIGG